MKNRVHQFCFALTTVAVMIGIGCPASAQEHDSSGVRQRSYSMRVLEREAKRSGVRLPETAADLSQLRKDFERIQVLDRDVIQAVVAGERLDYGELSAAATEINKRCRRLQSYLLPVERKGKWAGPEPQEAAAGREDLPAMLKALDSSILSLVSNPVFQNTRVVDAEHSEEARGDMAKIVSLSEKVRKEANRLKEASVGELPRR